MSTKKPEILNKICYTELVYQRINKKLNIELSKSEIEKMVYTILNDTPEKYFEKIGKNIYVHSEKNIKITINSNTFRIITVDKIDKKNIS
jgi:3-polyprenyl-4-hydroxybenzoate decarboxylase